MGEHPRIFAPVLFDDAGAVLGSEGGRAFAHEHVALDRGEQVAELCDVPQQRELALGEIVGGENDVVVKEVHGVAFRWRAIEAYPPPAT